MRTRALRGAEVRLDHISEVEDDITDLFITRIEAIKAELPDKKTEYIEAHDNDSHRYQIPWDKREDWYKWCEIPSDDERSWDTPDYAERIDGMEISDNRGFNQAIDQAHTILDNEIKRLKGEV
jgi:hypothetical protein